MYFSFFTIVNTRSINHIIILIKMRYNVFKL